MRRRRPGVTAAATTAVLAIGAPRPGVTAAATTAIRATGAPTTPTRPIRPGLNGISFSLVLAFGFGFDRRNDRLDRNATVGDQLASRSARCGCKRRRPEVLPDEDTGGAPWFHGGCQMYHIVGGQQFGELRLDRLKWTEVRNVGELHGVDV